MGYLRKISGKRVNFCGFAIGFLFFDILLACVGGADNLILRKDNSVDGRVWPFFLQPVMEFVDHFTTGQGKML